MMIKEVVYVYQVDRISTKDKTITRVLNIHFIEQNRVYLTDL
jgi:hypothetical protein